MFNSNFWEPFQSFVGFLKKLLVAHWRSLLGLLIGVYLPLQGFGVLAVQVWKNEAGFPWDVPILLAIHERSHPQLDVFAATFTKLGVFWGVFPVATVIGLMLLRQGRWRSLAFLIVTLLGSTTINRTAKAVFHRARPHLWEILSPKLDFAFPSGHAMSSMSLVVTLVILSWGTRWRWPTLIFGSLFVVAIAWTRLYLGVHFPSDILAGWMIAIAWVIGVSLVIQPNLLKPTTLNNETSLTQKENERNQAATQA
jgi:membrane-associated phospholipid phosphatase